MALVQTCDVDEKEASYFLTAIDDETITKSLYNANGKCGNVGVSSTRNKVTKCDFSTKGQPVPVSFATEAKSVVVDIDVLCFKNNQYGIVVAMNFPSREEEVAEAEPEGDGFMTKREKAAREESASASAHRPYNMVSLYVENYCSVFKLYRNIKVFGEITCMRVLISPVDMSSQAPFLSEKIGAWPNIVAIGCQKSSCYLGQYAAFDPDNADHWASEDVLETKATTDALKALVTGNRFNYSTNGVNNYFNKDDEHVTAVSYIPCYGVVLVGLSNGCVIMVPLDGKSSISCLTVPYSTAINFLVVLEPEYDPQGGFFVFTARERPRVNSKNACLVVFSHKIARQPDGTGGYEYQDMSSVMIPMRDGRYWVNVHGVVKKRKRREADAGNDTTGDNSQLPEGLNTTQHMNSDGMERTLLFYSYITLNGEMKGGLFDLNAFYTRRCGTQQVRFDDYGQDPICSQFILDVPRRNTGDPLFRAKDIAWVHCESITRYASPLFDRDALFQPMAAALNLVIHTYGKYAYAATVDSLQLTVLDRIARSLPSSLSTPDVAVAMLERVGLVLAPTTRKERMRMEERPANERVPSELDKIMRAIVADAYVRKQLIKFIETCTDRKQLLHVGRWMFNELREIVVRMDESIAPLFDGVSPDLLSKDAKEMIAFCPAFFEFAELVFWKVRGRGQEMANDTPRLRYVRKIHALMAFDLRLFLGSVKWLTRRLPMCEGWTNELLEEVAELNERRRDRARRERHPLFLDALLARLHEKTMEDELWRGLSDPVHWYPPPRFNLVSLLRQNAAPLADRAALVFYFLMDVDEAVRRDGERTEDEKRGYPVKDSLVRSFLIWEAGKLVDGQGCDGVRERWESDVKGRPSSHKENGALPVALSGPSVSRLTEEEKTELSNLLRATSAFRKLQKVDEDRMKVLMNKQDFGIYRFNLFLIKKGRYPEVEDLPVPGPSESSPHVVVAEYAKYKDLALAQKAQLPPPTGSNAFACPYVITKGAPKSDANSTMNSSRIVRTDHVTIRGKTPKKLNIFRRLTTAPTEASTSTAAAAAGGDADVMSTPPNRPTREGEDAETARINALMKTPSMKFHNQQEAMDEEDEEGRDNDSNVAPDEMARVREALRTPRSRAALAARAAVGEGTPEDAPRPAMTVPTSILKSAHKDSRLPQSANKSRLRFAHVFEEKSISPRERDNSASTSGSMSQPNFDDSFDDDRDNNVLPKSASHSMSDGLNLTTRLEKEIEEEEQRKHAGRRAEEPEEVSMESGDLQPLSSGDEGEEEMTEEGQERSDDRLAAATAAATTFSVYHDSEGSAASSAEEDEAEAAFVEEDDNDSLASAAAGDAAVLVEAAVAAAPPKTPPPTPEEEEEEVALPTAAAGDDVAGDEDENVSRGVTPVDEEEEKEEERPLTPVTREEEEEEVAAPAAEEEEVAAPAVEEEEVAAPAAEEEEVAAPAAEEEEVAAPAVEEEEVAAPAAEEEEVAAPAVEEEEVAAPAGEQPEDSAADHLISPVGGVAAAATTPTAATNETFTVANATFTVDTVRTPGQGEGEEQEETAAGEEEMEEDSADTPMEEEEAVAETVADAAAAALEEKQPEAVEPAAVAAGVPEELEEEDEKQPEAVENAAAAALEEKEAEPAAPAVEDKEESAAPAAEEEQQEDEEANLSRGITPVDGEEKEDEDEFVLVFAPPPAVADGDDVAADEGEKNVSRGTTPVEEREKEEEKEVLEEDDTPEMLEEEEEEVAAPTVAASVAAPQPPIPKPRTVFPNRAEPISLGLRSYIYMEDGIEKSYEEQRDTDDEKEEGEQDGDILARLSPRRSSSRLQQRGETSTAAATAAAPAASGGRKRSASKSRRDSEKEAAGPSTSMSPRGKKERREEEEEKKEEGEEGEGHLFTTTRTRVVEERYVERDDGVLQHTVKQSTKVVEMTDGVVVKDEQEDKETIEEEGDREENREETPSDEAGRATPSMLDAAAEPATDRRSSRLSTTTASRSRTQSTTSKATSTSPKKKEEEKKREEKATTPLRSPEKTVRRRRLMTDESERKEEEKEKEHTVPLTPRRSTRVHRQSESTSVSAVTPSKGSRKSTRTAQTPSREPSAAPSSPVRRLVLDNTVESPKDTVATTPRKRGRPKKESTETTDAPAAPPLVLDEEEEKKEDTGATTPRKRGRPKKEPLDAAADTPAVPVPAKRRTVAATVSTVGSARKRSASESVHNKKKEEKVEEEEEMEDAIAALRRKRDQSRVDAEKRRKEDSKRNASRSTSKKLVTIPEDTVAKISGKKRAEEQTEDQPSTSQAPTTRRKRSQSENAAKEEKEPVLKTPAKKKAKDDEDDGVGDLSMLRRSTRKAAVSANEGLKTPSKSSRGKQ